MLREPRRLIASIIAIAAGVAFVAATLLLSASLENNINAGFAGQSAGSAVVIAPGTQAMEPPAIPQSAVDAIAKVATVTKARPVVETGVMAKDGKGTEQFYYALSAPELTRTTTLTDGRLPTARGEVAISAFAAKNRGLTVGSRIDISAYGDQPASKVTVVGIIEPGKEVTPSADTPILFATLSDLDAWRGASGYTTVFVHASGDPGTVRDEIRALPQVKALTGVAVSTTADYLAEQRKAMADMMRVITGFLLAFGVIALAVSAMVIANTFSILVAQRTRQLALLRCVGATRGQVFRTVVWEALLMGLVGGVLGLIGGVGLTLVLLQVAKAFQLGTIDLVVTPLAIVVPVLLGAVVTLVASLMPARRATRVMPLAALRPNLAPPASTRAGRAVLVAGGVLLALGVAALLYGAVKPGFGPTPSITFLVVGIAGGLVSFVGVLMLGTVIIPALARVVGVVPSRLGGVPGRLAAENSRRNPSRAAATASALLVGVTLITMVAVGAQSGRATQQLAFDRLFPADLTVTPRSGQASEAMLTKLKGVKGVTSVARVDSASVRVGDKLTNLAGLSPEVRGILRYTPPIDGLADDTVLMPKDAGYTSGAAVTVTGSKGTKQLRVVVNPRSLSTPVVTMATLAGLAEERQQSLWFRVADDAKPSVVAEQVSQDLADYGVQVNGAALMREQMDGFVNVIVGIVAGLLAASVLIALVGITNTLGLSVLERTQESGLLRALGLPAGGLRAMFGIEAVMLATVAVLLGLALGIGYGVAGTYALLKGATSVVVIDIPWAILGIVAAVAAGSGLVASVLPAVRAGRIKPAAALAAGE